jgi:Glyoxalase-like domain
LVQAGASLAWETDDARGSAVVLRDPEGNEFCVSLPADRGGIRKQAGVAPAELTRGDGRRYPKAVTAYF